MLNNHTHERLAALGLAGMAKAFDDQQRQPDDHRNAHRGRAAAEPREHQQREQHHDRLEHERRGEHPADALHRVGRRRPDGFVGAKYSSAVPGRPSAKDWTT